MPKNNRKYIVGIDEVGRGPIAGPVAVCAFICEENFQKEIEMKVPLRDSKKLTKIQREKWFAFLQDQRKEGKCDFAVTMVSSEWIDKVGIVRSIQKALDQSLDKVIKNYENQSSGFSVSLQRRETEGSPSALSAVAENRARTGITTRHKTDFQNFYVYLDGGLKAPKEYTNQETIIKGDELHPVISFASIVAKVTRDNLMEKYALEFTEYGFEMHSGYGTKAHYEAIKKYGLSTLHRKSFLKNI